MRKEWNRSRSLTRAGENENPGCMSGMLHYLDFHHLLFASGHDGTSSSNRGRALPPSSPSPRVSRLSNSQFKGSNIGLEAPRNSLEMDDGKASMSALAMKEEFYVDVPAGIQVVPVASSSASSKKSMMMVLQDGKRSPSPQGDTPRTPSVVARLMGLEVTTDQVSSPGSCSPRTPTLVGKSKQSTVGNGDKKEQMPQRQPLRSLNCSLPALSQLRSVIDINSSLSLPETPRTSASSTRSRDPRLSLQLNKENTSTGPQVEFRYLCQAPGDYALPTSPSASATAKSKRKHCYVSRTDEHKCPSSHYCVREIAKQLKATISSARGGIGSNEANGETRAKLKMSSSLAKKKRDYDEETQSQAMPSVIKPQPPPSPPARLPEVHKTKEGEDRALKPPLPPNYEESDAARDEGRVKILSTVLPNRCKKAASERLTTKIKKQSRAKENNKGRPSSSQSLQTLELTEKQIALHRHNKRSQNASSNVTSTRSKEASALSPCPSPSSGQEHVMKVRSSSLRPSGAHKALHPSEQDSEYRYVKSVLERAHVTETGAAPCPRWHSPTLPVDPALFHQLELEFQEEEECRLRLGPLRHQWNRKLLFHVVEEVLADLLVEWSDRPSSGTLADHMLSRESRRSLHFLSCGEEPLLLRQLWARIRSFQEADCRVVGDIDALAAGDLSEANTRRLLRHPSVVEEAEDVVAEVEQELLDSIIEEAAAWLGRAAAWPELPAVAGARHHGDTHNHVGMCCL